MSRPLAASRWARARWLVLAPHPDDETLGAGALIAEAARAGRLAGVLFLTDGEGSHPPGTHGLAAARRRESRLALRRLAGTAVPVVRLGWRDARPATGAAFARDARRLAALLRRWRVDAVAATGAHETHCDHAACARLANAARAGARRAVTLFDYAVWPGARPRGEALHSAAMPPGRRRHALAAHRSQLGPAYGDGFRLPRARLRMPARDVLHRRTR